jgi:hypothetical protein
VLRAVVSREELRGEFVLVDQPADPVASANAGVGGRGA